MIGGIGLLFWKEIYIGFSQEEFGRVRGLLKEKGIPYRYRVNSPGERMGGNVSLGGSPAALNTAGMDIRKEYRIFVKKSDLEEAAAVTRGRN